MQLRNATPDQKEQNTAITFLSVGLGCQLHSPNDQCCHGNVTCYPKRVFPAKNICRFGRGHRAEETHMEPETHWFVEAVFIFQSGSCSMWVSFVSCAMIFSFGVAEPKGSPDFTRPSPKCEESATYGVTNLGMVLLLLRE